ncbi:MAG TPA: translation initiation factor [Spirochaetota bacterium]|nr:translation initiation factor [Spirochaetota bacterium]
MSGKNKKKYNNPHKQQRTVGELTGMASPSRPVKQSKNKPAEDKGFPQKAFLEIWLSKKHRGGKTVSLLKNSRLNPDALKTILKYLKVALACGGSVKGGEIIIQSDKRNRIKELLQKKNINSKICGG